MSTLAGMTFFPLDSTRNSTIRESRDSSARDVAPSCPLITEEFEEEVIFFGREANAKKPPSMQSAIPPWPQIAVSFVVAREVLAEVLKW